MKNRQKYSDEDYLNAELFQDRDLEIRALKRQIVTTRKEHPCAFSNANGEEHTISACVRVVRESAIVEGKWGTCHSCLPCIDKWLDHLRGLDEE